MAEPAYKYPELPQEPEYGPAAAGSGPDGVPSGLVAANDNEEQKEADEEEAEANDNEELDAAEREQTERAIAAHMSQQARAKVRKTFDDIATLFRSKGERLDSETTEKLVTENPPEHPKFPFFILAVAIAKDLLAIPLELTGLGIVVVCILGIVLSLILTVWTWNRLSGGWWKKRLITWMWTWLAAVIVIELIPGIQMIPAETIFILMAHFKERKLVKLFDAALEQLHRADVLKYIE